MGTMAKDSSLEVDSELPVRLTQLLRRLNGDLRTGETAITSTGEVIHYLSSGDIRGMDQNAINEILDLVDYLSDAGLMGMAQNVRKKVLYALGACETLRSVSMWGFSELSASDWETFLIPLKRSTVLEEVEFYDEKLRSKGTKGVLGRLWADVLKTVESVRKIRFEGRSGLTLGSGFHAELIVCLSDCALPSLTDCFADFIWDSATALHIANMIRHFPQLRRLELSGFCTLSEDAINAWSQALMGAESLEQVMIGSGVERSGVGISRALVEGFSASCRKNVLKRLEFVSECKDLEKESILPLLVTANIAELFVGVPITLFLSPGDWRKAGLALLQVKALRRLQFRVLAEWARGIEGIRSLWEVSGQSCLISLVLVFRSGFDSGDSLTDILKLTIPTEIEAGEDFLSLVERREVKDLFARTDCPVKTLSFPLHPNVSLKALFPLLRENTSITKLDLGYVSLDDHEFKELMNLLQVNLTLQDINLEGTPWMNDGKAALIKEALERNSQQASYYSVMREAKFSFDKAKVGRIFLCGSPFAGKTRLKRTMLGINGGMFKRVAGKLQQGAELGRTKGIEVDWLWRDDGRKVSIWDLGGQYIFRALQELLFPKISRVWTFIFVYSPFDRIGKKHDRVPRGDPVADFEEDLKQWLRYIVSNTQVIGNILPRVFVTITNKDHIQSAKYNRSFVLDSYVQVVVKLRSKFGGVVDLCDIHYINAKHDADVKHVMDSVLQWMDQLLEKKTPRVPSICSNLVLQLAERCPDILVSPVQNASSFYKYCCEASVFLEKFDPTDDQGRKVLHAVASFMHDVGSIIMVPSVSTGGEDLVVVDPNWLTRDFLGELIGQGHGFRSQKEKLWSLPLVKQDGTASEQYLRDLLDHILGAKENKGKKLKFEILLELLQGLDLCYTVASDTVQPMYFMPLIIGTEGEQPEEMNGHTLAWKLSSSAIEDSRRTFFGFRMQRRDCETTCLSSVLYPRFQIRLRQALVKSLGEYRHTFKFARDYLQVEADGHEIIVENDGTKGDHVDFLVRGSSHKSREEAKQFVRKHFMDEFSSFCATPEGCQGVQLVVAILRPAIVKELIRQEFRGKALPVDELKQTFESYLIERLQEGGDEDAAFSYEHQWPSIPEAGLGSRSELAKDLLQEQDIQQVIVAIHNEHLQNRLKLQKLQFISKQLDDHGSPENRETVMQILQSVPSFKSSSYSVGGSSASTFTHSPDEVEVEESVDTPVELDGFQRLEDRMNHLEHRLDQGFNQMDRRFNHLHHRLDMDFQQLRAELRDFKVILEDMKSTMTTIMSQVDRMFGYTKFMQQRKIPCRPYFTLEDVSIVQRVNAHMRGAKAVRLHFMCESKQGHHFVEDQPGIIIQVEKDDTINKCLRKISDISIQLFIIMAEVGVHLTTGVGSAVPEIFSLVTNSVVPVKNLSSVLQGSELDDLKALEEAWWHLGDYLRDVAHIPLDKYSMEFRLHPVTYKDREDPFAWLCDKCTKSGKRSSLLD